MSSRSHRNPFINDRADVGDVSDDSEEEYDNQAADDLSEAELQIIVEDCEEDIELEDQGGPKNEKR
jgi:hypothetical protein